MSLYRKKAEVNMDGHFLVRQIYDDQITYNLVTAAVEILSKLTIIFVETSKRYLDTWKFFKASTGFSCHTFIDKLFILYKLIQFSASYKMKCVNMSWVWDTDKLLFILVHSTWVEGILCVKFKPGSNVTFWLFWKINGERLRTPFILCYFRKWELCEVQCVLSITNIKSQQEY